MAARIASDWSALQPPGQLSRRVPAADGYGYELMLAVPDVPAPPAGHPVMVVLDGGLHFQLVAGAAAALARRTAKTGVAPLAVAGIAFEGARHDSRRRAWDFTTGEPAAPETAPHPGGGGEAFFDYLTERAMPAFQAAAPLDLSRAALFSHSLGALFGLYALGRAPGLFRAWTLISPSLWWTPGLALTAATAASGRDLSVHLAWGEREAQADPDRRAMGRRAAEALQGFAAVLAPGAVTGGELVAEDHGSSPFAACPAALRAAVATLARGQ
ncbi:alpha/beta hydrolase [Phenylobacterium sp.]|jgi:predicted alpha/beta superfamily hydrolase|uniref:alpha/beta hydrolase n=1 Tax=Phenylobacterium sp. TaxID=1871053 RepID=UPI003785231B